MGWHYFIQLLTDPVTAFLTLIGLIFILHIIIRIKNPSKKTWKKVDYVWLIVAAFGLIGLTKHAQQLVARSDIKGYDWRIESDKNTIESDMHTNWFCRTFVRDNYSPEYFDQEVLDYKHACQWEENMQVFFERLDSLGKDTVPITGLPLITRVIDADSEILSTQKNIVEHIRTYNNDIIGRDNAEAAIEEGDLDRTLQALSPLFLIIALALRFTKTTGEIMHEK